MYHVLVSALKSWPEKYRPNIVKDNFKKDVNKWDKDIVYAGFSRVTNEMCGFALLKECPRHLEFSILRVRPEMERDGINAAIVAGILESNNERIGKNLYINDGARSIRHETAFQDYLEKYFGFRKAYCKLHILYRFPLNVVVRVLFPLRKRIKSESRIGSLLGAVLKMEECRRQCV